MSEDSKAEKEVEAKPIQASESDTELTVADAAAIAEAEAETAIAKAEAARLAAETAADAEYEKAAAEIVAAKISDSFTNKRSKEQIFRREMDEPEFFLYKKDLAPPRPVLTDDEEKEITRKVQIPADQTPKFIPDHMLTPEYEGTSNYEIGINIVRKEIEEKLKRLQDDPEGNSKEIKLAEKELGQLDYLSQNFNIGMNVFRTARGGRAKLQK